MDEWDHMKFKSFCTMKEMLSKLKRPPTKREIISASCTSDKELITKINDPMKKWAQELNRAFSKDEFQMTKQKKPHEKNVQHPWL
jgi:hypothetical protein